ncbi:MULTISPECIES: hypothetical protein [unclassified Corallococcus]|uniref:hypothetical protein n=1 Tax=unclassified Corallococcus TaxID=2685029 RepID=UPI001A8D81F8|nr:MULTISPECIES: hypothetical protein [unclassified Corallococcus]MBN9687143.1 hypothetical protein [Corallococcus sp. NCSPR001]WAS89030.1 hypothetical protein O0N60_19105 [Corallococcus sp. NCRR]
MEMPDSLKRSITSAVEWPARSMSAAMRYLRARASSSVIPSGRQYSRSARVTSVCRPWPFGTRRAERPRLDAAAAHLRLHHFGGPPRFPRVSGTGLPQ